MSNTTKTLEVPIRHDFYNLLETIADAADTTPKAIIGSILECYAKEFKAEQGLGETCGKIKTMPIIEPEIISISIAMYSLYLVKIKRFFKELIQCKHFYRYVQDKVINGQFCVYQECDYCGKKRIKVEDGTFLEGWENS